MTTEARRVKRGGGALILTLALLLLAAVPAAHADTIYPNNQIEGTSFDAGADGFTTVSNGCRLLLGLIPTDDEATCQTMTSHNPTVGNPPGSLEQSYQAVANALSPLLFDATAVARSPEFTVATGGPTSFQVDRRADVLALLDLGTNATYTFRLVDVTAGGTSQVLATENVTDADNAFQSVLNEALAPTITGHTYYIEVTTVFRTALLSVALGRMVVDFDNVRLRVKDGTPTFGAPTVVTDPATDITETGATLNGRVNANGVPTTFTYSYGTAANALNTTIGPFNGGELTEAVSRPRSILGLTGCTTYFFRIQATNGQGSTTGLTRSFRTDCKPTVTTLPATGVGATAATFNSRINPEGPETKYYYEYIKVSGGPLLRTPAVGQEVTIPAGHSESVPNSYPVDGLTPQTAYAVRVVAFNALGTTTGSAVGFVTTGTGAAGPPGAAGAPGAPGTPGAPGAPADNGGGSGLNKAILNLLSGDKRAMMRIDGQRLVVPTRGRFKGRLRIRILCRPIAVRTCSGTVKVRSRTKINPDSQGKNRRKTQVTFATSPVQLDRKKIGYAILQFNDQRLALLKRLKSVKVEVIAALIDGDNNRQNVRRNRRWSRRGRPGASPRQMRGRGPSSRRARSRLRASSTSASPIVSGGSSRTVAGPVALSTRRCSCSARRTSSGPVSPALESRSKASISPRPRTSTTPGSAPAPSASRAPSVRTRPSRSGSQTTSSTACAAAQATGPPANVEP